MQNVKRHLDVVDSEGNSIVKGTTCFSVQAEHKVDCERKKCQHWISHKEGHNCVLISAQQGAHTLQEIGRIYNLTRMRICQIEKNIYEKIRNVS